MTIKAIFWDLDGTLVDTKSLLIEVLQEYYLEVFGWEVTLPMILRYFNNGLTDQVKKIARDLEKEITPEEAQAFGRKVLDRKNELELPFLPNAKELLLEAKKLGLKLALCSNNTHADLEKNMKMLGLEGFFDVIVGDDDVEKKKPAPDMLLLAMDKLGLNAEEVVHVEDSPPGIKAGKAAGVKVLATATGTKTVDELEPFEPNEIVADLTEITLDEILNI